MEQDGFFLDQVLEFNWKSSLGAKKTFGSLPFEGLEAQGWVADLIKQLEGRTAFSELSPSEHFQGLLRPYQVKGFSWLAFLGQWGLGACLADDMGLGKTIQTLALIQRNWRQGEKRPVLLISPMSVVNNWGKRGRPFYPGPVILGIYLKALVQMFLSRLPEFLFCSKWGFRDNFWR